MILREAQLLLGYRDSELVGGRADRRRAEARRPRPGRAGPSAPRRRVRPAAVRAARGATAHALLYAETADDATDVDELGAAARSAAHGRLDAYVVLAPDADPAPLLTPAVRDAAGTFAAAYLPGPSAAFVVRPDGYLGYRGDAADIDALTRYLKATFA